MTAPSFSSFSSSSTKQSVRETTSKRQVRLRSGNLTHCITRRLYCCFREGSCSSHRTAPSNTCHNFTALKSGTLKTFLFNQSSKKINLKINSSYIKQLLVIKAFYKRIMNNTCLMGQTHHTQQTQLKYFLLLTSSSALQFNRRSERRSMMQSAGSLRKSSSSTMVVKCWQANFLANSYMGRWAWESAKVIAARQLVSFMHSCNTSQSVSFMAFRTRNW